MKKRILTVLLAVCLVFALGTVSALADGVNEVETASELQSALSSGGDIRLSSDIDATSVTLGVANGITVTIDLNGKTLTIDEPINVDGVMYVEDSTATTEPSVDTGDNYKVTYQAGSIHNTYGTKGNNAVVITVRDGGTFVHNSGILKSDKNYTIGIYGEVYVSEWDTPVNSEAIINGGYQIGPEGGPTVFGNGATLTITGGVLEGTDNAVVSGNGTLNETYNYGGYTINIEGGTLIGRITSSGYISCAVYHPNSGTLNISGGLLVSTNGVGILSRAGTTNITGGTIRAEGDSESTGWVGDAKNQVGKYGVIYDLRPTYPGRDDSDVIHISGSANVNGTAGAVEVVEEDATSGEHYDEIVITGGSFSSNIDNYIPTDVALKWDSATNSVVKDESKTTVATVDGVPFTDLASAIGFAEDGDTVEITESCTLDGSVDITKNITINGNGHTVTAENAAFYIKADLQSFTVKDLTLKGELGNGETFGEGSTGPWMGIGTYNGNFGVGQLTLTDVTIDGFSYGLYFGMNPDGAATTLNTNPVSVEANNLTIQNCGIKGAYFEKLTESTFTNCKFLNNGTEPDKVGNADFRTWMCGIDINLKGSNYKDIVFEGCTFEGNGSNSGTALHIKARDDGNYSGDKAATLTGVTVTGCTFEDNNVSVPAPIVIGEPDKGNKTPTNVSIQPDVAFTNNLAKDTVYTVEYKGDGVSEPTVLVDANDKITLPAPTRSGYEFRGWRGSDGKLYKAGAEYTVTGDVTFTAVWDAIDIPNTYPINVADAANGEVSTSLTNASRGSVITITATPDAGYSVGSVSVTGPDGRVDVKRVNSTTYTFVMPEGEVTVRVTFTTGLPFTDVSANQWFYEAVSYVYTNGMMEGDSSTNFNPDGQMTRAMVWVILARIDGETVTGANWIDTARAWAMAEGVSDGTDPNGLVTREQFATMLWRYAVAKGYDVSIGESTNILSYADFASISEYAIPAMQWACGSGIVTGVTDSTLVPQGTATRAQCAAIFMRYDQM